MNGIKKNDNEIKFCHFQAKKHMNILFIKTPIYKIAIFNI